MTYGKCARDIKHVGYGECAKYANQTNQIKPVKSNDPNQIKFTKPGLSYLTNQSEFVFIDLKRFEERLSGFKIVDLVIKH